MKTIAHFIAWHMAFGPRPIYLRSEDCTPEGYVKYLDDNIRTVEETPIKEYIFRYPAVQVRLLGAKWLRKQYRQFITE